MSENTQILTPVGRLVQGDCFEGQTTDAEGKPLVIREGANAGKTRTTWFMAIAIAKSDPGYAELWAKIYAEAVRSFPLLFDPQGRCSLATFAFKVRDGDSTVPNQKGIRPCDLEGFPGHWILNFSGGFAPKVYQKGGNSLVVSSDEIKRGYYIRIAGTVAGNKSQIRPGVYLNHAMVELCGYGPEIFSGPDPKLFGESPAGTLPSGASVTPLAPSTGMPGAPPSAPVIVPPGMMPPVMPPGVVSALTPPIVAPSAIPPGIAPGIGVPAPIAGGAPSSVQPAPDFLNPPAPVETLYTLPDGTRWTRAQLTQSGWTPEAIDAIIPF